jgi:hypothetical protein
MKYGKDKQYKIVTKQIHTNKDFHETVTVSTVFLRNSKASLIIFDNKNSFFLLLQDIILLNLFKEGHDILPRYFC